MITNSFIVITHSKRFDNLSQTIRFLTKRENSILSVSELIVVCQDKIELDNLDFAGFTLINLGKNLFSKPLMCNTGVNAAIGENIVLLDDDRILPHNWFTKQLTLLRQGSVISAHRLYRLNFSCSDEQIDFVPKLKDFRIADMGTIGDNLGAKTVFSGNAVMKKDDYLDLGSMDESFVGYGYSDTDFSYKTWKAGLKIILANDDELHLWHSLDINLEEFNKSNFDNALKFCKKWEIVPSVHWKALWKRYHGLNI